MKKYLGIFIVMLAVVTSAFTVNHKKTTLIGNSYTYNLSGLPGQDDITKINDPANYTFAGTGSLSCSGTAHRCGVENATDDGFGHPNFNKSYTARMKN